MKHAVIVRKVLVMAVNPGNAGQMFLPFVGKKVKRLLRLKKDYKFEIFWDGACGMDKVEKFGPMGVDGFILGTTILFGKERNYGDILSKLPR